MASTSDSSADSDVSPLSRRRRLLIYLTLIALVSVIYERGDDALDGLYERADDRLEDWRRLDADLSQPGTGLEEMDANVMASVELLKRFNVPDFRIAKGLGFGGGGYLRQRIDEVAWPIPYAGTSKFLLRFQGEADSCATTLATAAEVALDRCD